MPVQKKEIDLVILKLQNQKLPFHCTNLLLKQLRTDLGKMVQTGEFGADMKVATC